MEALLHIRDQIAMQIEDCVSKGNEDDEMWLDQLLWDMFAVEREMEKEKEKERKKALLTPV